MDRCEQNFGWAEIPESSPDTEAELRPLPATETGVQLQEAVEIERLEEHWEGGNEEENDELLEFRPQKPEEEYAAEKEKERGGREKKSKQMIDREKERDIQSVK